MKTVASWSDICSAAHRIRIRRGSTMSERTEGHRLPKAHGEEWESDRLVQLLGPHVLASLDLGDPEAAAFVAWLAAELRSSATAQEQAALSARADAFVARARQRTGSGELGVMRIAHRPATRQPAVEGPVAATLDAASALRCAPALDLGVAAGVGRELWDEPCSTWVELPDRVPDGRYVALTVAGESMEPLLHGGDTILVRLGASVAKGAVIVARRPDDGYVVKRVGALTPRTIELESLGAGYPPVRIPRRTDLVLGTVVLRWCEHAPPAVGAGS
jgi:hypothetical protein